MKFFHHKKILPVFLFLAIVAGSFVVRTYDINWDSNYHLHPDERFLTMVGNAMAQPKSFAEYINPQTSTFNPTNVGFQFYVYGTLPLVVNKLLALQLHSDTYNDFTIQGRFLSALFDTLTLIVLFKIAKLFEIKYKLAKEIKYYTIFLYAISVLPIQLSHFFAVDTFLNFFVLLSLYFALSGLTKRYLLYCVLSGIAFGCAIGSKISAIYALPLILTLLVLPLTTNISFKKMRLHIDYPKNIVETNGKILVGCIAFAITGYLVARLTDPYLFASTNVFNYHLNSVFLQNIASLQSYSNKDAWFPPAVQWINKPPLLFSLYNIAFFGLGIMYFFLALFGMIQICTKKKFILILIVLWMCGFFIYQSTQFANTMRYFIFLYPLFAFFAAIGLHFLTKKNSVRIAIVLIVLLWPLAFFNIYTKPHSRVTASEWMYQSVPDKSVILSEYWDDALPLPIPSNKTFVSEQIAVFDPDTNEKWQKLQTQLDTGNYLVLSSNRGWGSIPTVPTRYPRMTQFYLDLFAGKLAYKKVAEFTLYPSLSYLGIPITIPDQIAEEAFTVYDHPKVMIFKNTAYAQ